MLGVCRKMRSGADIIGIFRILDLFKRWFGRGNSVDQNRMTTIRKLAIDKYLGSRDFNGLPIRDLRKTETLIDDISTLIRERAVDLVRGDVHPNPHIKALPADDINLQLKKISEEGLGEGCLYPTQKVLSKFVRQEEYEDRPFSLELALGTAQLDFRPFDLRALEFYRNDPRFRYNVDEIYGSIAYRDEYFGEHSPAHDKMVLERFGFCYTEDHKRAMAIFLRDLNKLDAPQQQHWHKFLLKPVHHIHPEFYRKSVLGDWSSCLSIYDVFLEEKNQINIMSLILGKEPLFKSKHKAHNRPERFGLMLRPTSKDMNEFEIVLDNLMSSDLNHRFFLDHGLDTKGKKTIQALEVWLNTVPQFTEAPENKTVLKTFRKIRDRRAKPAHKNIDNEFDEKYLVEQRQLIISALNAIRALRNVILRHPDLEAYEVPEALRNESFWTG